MAQQPPRRGGAPDQDPAAFSFAAKVENEEQLLDAVLASLARGAFPTDAWERLHAAAARDGRTSELAFAFETVSQGKRLKTVPPLVAAEFLYQAARFFADVFGDELGAVSCLERALVVAPTHAAALAKVEELLVKAGQPRKLAEVLASNGLHRPRGEQTPLLRRAADLLATVEGADDKLTEVLQHLVKLDPSDDDARSRLEALYVKANRFRDVLRLCEQGLAATDPAPTDASKKKLLVRVVELYADKLHEPERAMPHVEALLALDPASDDGRRVAQKLVVIKGLAGRAAAALATASEAFGTPQEVARYLTIELENTRGPKRAELLARLGRLRQERMADEKGAFEAFEQAIAIDASDDDVRARYLDLAGRLQRHGDAAKTLSRLLAAAKDATAKAKTSAQLGQMLLSAGDPKRARSTLVAVLAMPDAPADATLAAAHTLREILEKEKDGRALLDVLERIATLEPDPEKRREVDERLSELAALLKDSARAIAANERLLSTTSRAKALTALAPLYEASGAPDKLARLLEERAKDSTDAAEARAMLLRAADVRTRDAGDAPGAIATYETLVARFGWAREVVIALVPLLEGERRWDALADALAHGAALSAAAPEKAGLFAQIGVLRASRLRDPAGAIEAFARALDADASEKTARATLEKLAAHGDHRLDAARVLERLYRAEGAAGPLLKILEIVGSLATQPEERLASLREAADLANAASGPDAARGIDLAGRGLTEAVGAGLGVGEWLDRLDRSGAPGADPKRRAGILARALGERPVTSDELSLLAKRTADAFARCGEVEGAIAIYRRALAFEPHSGELLARIDELLQERGSPAERVALYTAAIEGSSPERAKELRHRIGVIQRKDLGDADAAARTYHAIIELDPDDADAYAALEEIFGQAARWADLCALLEARIPRVSGEMARAVRATLARVAAEHGDAARARTQCARLLEDPELSLPALDAVEQAADHLADADLARAVLHRRAEMARDPREQIGWLERLARLDAEKRGDLESAAAVWKRAADLADQSGDDANARRLYWDARKVAPEDSEINARLASLCERAGSWADLPRLYAALADQSADDSERVTLALRAADVLDTRLGDPVAAARQAERAFELAPTRADTLAAFERLAVSAGSIDAFEQAVDAALARSGAEAKGRLPLLLARARVIGNDRARIDEAARAYRDILADVRVDPTHQAMALAAFEALVAAGVDSPGRRADRRWLFEWRAEHAAEAERTLRLLEWARQEEAAFGDASRALALHRRVLAIDAECDESLSAVARLALSLGEADEALAALRARRERAAGPARVAIDLEIAQVLLSRPGGAKESIASLRAVLAESPGDATALALAAQLLMNRATRGEAVVILEQACEAADDPRARAQILVKLLDAPADDEDVTARHTWYERLCDLQRDSGDLEGALATSIRAARETPQVATFWERAEALARKVSRPDDVATLYAEVLARTLPREEALAMGERAVQFYEEWFEDPGRVVRILERVLEIDPAADWAFDRLKLVFDSAERWDDLFALYDRALESASDAKRTSLLEDAAQTAKDFANRPDRAIQYLEQLHELRPGDVKLASSLERLYERQGRHRELVSLLGERLPSLKRDDARRTRLRVATLWLDELGDPAAALEQVEPLLGNPGEGGNGVPSEVWSLLERVLAAAPPTPEPRKSSLPPPADAPPRSKRPRKSEPPSSAKGSVRKRTAAWLREHYAAAGRDADLARMLLVDLEGVRATKERVKRHLQVAELYERVGTLQEALEQTGFAFVLAPDAEAQRAALVGLAERTGRLDRLAELLAAGAETAEGQPLRTSLTMQAATVRADRLADAPSAIGLLASILAASGVPDADVLLAARRLDPLLEAAGRAEERLDVLERVANVEVDAAARREALGRAAVLASSLGQDDRAIELWERRLAADDRDGDALDGLVELLGRTQKKTRLAEVLALRARSTTADDRRRADRVHVARLLGEDLGRKEDAIDAWRAVERDFGEAADAALALAGLLRATERWTELAALLERGASHTDDAGTRAELLQQLGDVQRERLGALGTAVETYARSLAADPRNAQARAGLLVLAGDEAHAASAVDLLLGALRSCDDWRAVLELTEHRLRAAGTREAKVDILLESAEIAERRAGDPGLGFEAVRRATSLAPGEPRVRAELSRLAEATGSWRDLVATYRDAIDGAARGDAARVADLWHATAKVLDERLDEAPAALEAFKNVVAIAADTSAGASAVRVAARLGQWAVAAGTLVDLGRARNEASVEGLEALEREADRTKAWDSAARAMSETLAEARLEGTGGRDLYARLAVWNRDRRADFEGARSALRKALELDPSNAALLRDLAELERRDRGRPLVETLTRLSQATGGDPMLLREAAEVARDAVGDRGLARSILSDLFELAKVRWLGAAGGPPAANGTGEGAAVAEWTVETLAELNEADGDQRAVLDVLVAGDALPFERTVRRGMRRRAARIALDRLADPDRAIALYLALFDEDAHDAEAVERLGATYASLRRTRDLLRLRERQVEAAHDAAERLALRLEIAGLLGGLGEPEAGAIALRSNLSEDATHEATVEALARSLDEGGKVSELRDLLADQAQRAEAAASTARAAGLWARAAILAEGRLNDASAAATFHARVVALEPRAASFDALARLAEGRGDAASAAAWLEKLLAVVEPDYAGASALRWAEALVSSGDAAGAAARLEEWIPRVKDAEPLRARLATLYRASREWGKLAALAADGAAHAPDKGTRMARLLEAAKLFIDRCGEPARAVPLLEQASDLAPEDQTVRLGLADALAQATRFDEARSILQTMVAAFGGRRPKERAPVHYQTARLELAMGNRASALVELDVATRIDPQNPEILRTLAELARDDGQLERAEKSYRALLAVLRRREDSRETPSIARSEVLLELSAIAERDGETDRAHEILESAVEAATQSDFEQERLEAVLRKRGDDATLVRVLEAKLAHLGDTPAAAKTLGDLADVLVERLHRPDQALVARLRALSIDARSPAAHDAALALARSLGALDRYVDHAAALANASVEAGDSALACGLLVRLGGVAETDLHDDRKAAALYERALDLGQRSPELLKALDRLFERLGEPGKQARVLAMRVEVEGASGSSGVASDATYRLASLRLATRDAFDEGVAMLAAAFDADLDCDRARAILEKAVTVDAAHSALIDLYERVGRQPGQERALVDALRLRSAMPGSGVDTLREAVVIANGLGDGELARSLLARFVEARSGAAGGSASDLAWALRELSNLHESAGDLRKAVELKREAAKVAEPDEARLLRLEVAAIAADKLNDLALAAELYESVRAIDPVDREGWEPLVAVYRRMGEHRRLADLLAVVVDFVEEAPERARLRFERVRTMTEHLGLDDDGAARELREIVDEDPGLVGAALALASILERSGKTEELAALLSRQFDAARDRGEAASVASLALKLGGLVQTTDRAQARDVYYTGVDWDPKNRGLLDALLALLGSDDDAGERAEVLEKRLAAEEGPKAEEMARSLRALRVEQGDEAAAERALEVGYRAYPRSLALRDELERIYRARSDWKKLAELYAVEASGLEDAVARNARWKEAAAILREKVQDAASAAGILERAYAAAPADLGLLDDYVSALVEAGDSKRAIDVLGAALARAETTGHARATLLARRAAIQSAAGQHANALDDLEEAFTLDRESHAGALAAALAAAETTTDGDAEKLRLLRLRHAQVLPYAGDVDLARTILAGLLETEPRDREALRTLAGLEAALEAWDAASGALRRLVGLEEGQAAVDVALSLADACERAGRSADAKAALERARAAAPSDAGVRQRLERLYEQTGDWHELADLILEGASAAGDVADRFSLLVRAGMVLLEQAGDPEAAITALEQAKALRPGDADGVGPLAEAYTLAGRGADAVALLDAILVPTKGKRAKELAPLYWRQSRVLQHAGDAAGEQRALVMALECDSQNGDICASVAMRAIETEQLDLATRALRAVTMLKAAGPMPKGLAYQYLGEIAIKQNDVKRAVTLLKRACVEDPSLDSAKELLQQIERG